MSQSGLQVPRRRNFCLQAKRSYGVEKAQGRSPATTYPDTPSRVSDVAISETHSKLSSLTSRGGPAPLPSTSHRRRCPSWFCETVETALAVHAGGRRPPPRQAHLKIQWSWCRAYRSLPRLADPQRYLSSGIHSDRILTGRCALRILRRRHPLVVVATGQRVSSIASWCGGRERLPDSPLGTRRGAGDLRVLLAEAIRSASRGVGARALGASTVSHTSLDHARDLALIPCQRLVSPWHRRARLQP